MQRISGEWIGHRFTLIMLWESVLLHRALQRLLRVLNSQMFLQHSLNDLLRRKVKKDSLPYFLDKACSGHNPRRAKGGQCQHECSAVVSYHSFRIFTSCWRQVVYFSGTSCWFPPSQKTGDAQLQQETLKIAFFLSLDDLLRPKDA